MNPRDAAFTGSIPQAYDRWLGPIVFEPFADRLATRIVDHHPASVLELAAGTGIVTRRLRDRLPPTTEIVATDLNEDMLAVARSKFTAAEPVVFRTADAMALPFGDGRFSLVACQFGVMFFPDLTASRPEVGRVLLPDGRDLFSVWESHAFNPFARIAHTVTAAYFPADPPQFYQVPFSLHAIDPIKDALSRTGFTDITIHVDRLDQRAPRAADFARGMIHGNPLGAQIRARGGVDPEVVVEAVTAALQAEFGEDPITVPLQTICYDVRRC